MPRHDHETQETERPEIRELLERLAADGRAWAEAELALARIEAVELRRQLIKVLVFAMIGFATALCSLVVLSQAGIAWLAVYVGDARLAALIAAAMLCVIAAIFLLAMRKAFAWRTESIFFRWFGGPGAGP